MRPQHAAESLDLREVIGMQATRASWKRLGARRGHDATPANASASREAPPDAPPLPPLTTFIQEDCEIEGALVLQSSIQIDGEFRGRIETSETLTVGEGAAVQADVRARSVVIRGAVVGDVVASREVVLHAGARLHGNVDAPCFVIERGAFFNGATRMYRPEWAARDHASDAPRAVVADAPVV
jgi:cytoskeletal protein CcmA (bactofilin family)